MSPKALEAHISFLADDSLQGRGTGTRGYDIAARYVAACYSGLRLSPAGTRGYMQPVPLRSGRPVEGSSVVFQGQAAAHELRVGRDYVPLPDLLRPKTEVTAPVVFAGFGITAPERAHDDYRTIDARGKIVVVLFGGPASLPATERAHFSALRTKYENAVRHGAVGLLIVWSRDQSAPWEAIVNDLQGGLVGWLDERGEPDGAFPELRAKAVLSDSAAEALFQGAPRTYADILRAAKGQTMPAFDLPVRATIRTVTEHARIESPNVAGLLRGSDPRLRDEVVIYTAHLDHLGVGTPVKGDSIYNGALDNASGSAALPEVARAFASLPRAPRRSVLFLAVTGEEKGLIGSDYYAQHPTVPIQSIVANLNMDGLALLYPLRQVVPAGAEHSTLDAVVTRVAARAGMELGPDPYPEEVLFVRSDQYSFVRRGVPALYLDVGLKTDSGVDAAARLQEWIRTRYHTPQDDLSQPMDLESGARHAQFNFLVGLEIANVDERPAWKSGDFFGRIFGRDRTVQAR
ncbi:MAG TPA: M28 family metallopeptidase [Gemmatimonadales bacterium]|nr:M28 family metallopeptidase [Gemmatimonadales bacterium]